jgi:hypothetical protein
VIVYREGETVDLGEEEAAVEPQPEVGTSVEPSGEALTEASVEAEAEAEG